MKNSIPLMILLALFHQAGAQSNLGLEQYYYFGSAENISLVSIAYYQNTHNWYGEVRYNYEEKKTLSLYAGKTFNYEGKLSFAATPMLGILVGQFHGGSLGMNLDVTFKNIELSSQIQYVFSKEGKTKNFILNWSELSYPLLPFMRSGIALQHAKVYRSTLKMEAGAFMSFSYKNWGLPMYIFSPFSKERNYVIGVSWEWQDITNKNHGPSPLLKGRRKLILE